MKCPKCGNEISKGAGFCANCGNVLNLGNENYGDKFQENNASELYKNNNNKKSNKLLLIISISSAVIAVAVIVAFVIFLVFGNFGSEKNQNDSQSILETTMEETKADETQTTAVVTEISQETFAVPDVVGLRSEDAAKKLNEKGFGYEIVLSPSDTVQADYVISQSPVAGKNAEKGEKITIYVSKTNQSQQLSNTDYDISLYCRASEYATLRDEPSRTGKELARISCREEVKFYSTYGEFYCVSYKGAVGYVLGDFFSTDPNAPLNYGSGNAPINSSDSLYCRASDYATLRSSASRSSSELAKIYCREEVTYISSSGEFYYVSYRGTKGYVLKDYFSTDYNAPLNYGTY